MLNPMLRYCSLSSLVLIGLSGSLTLGQNSVEPITQNLWEDSAPGAKGDEAKDQPRLIRYVVPETKSTGVGVVVLPGGGYGGLAMGHEGHEIAQWLNANGISAFICDYRHRGKGYGHPAPMLDAQRAIRTVRTHAATWGVDPNRIGVIGFSAGGHLSSTVSTHFDAGDAKAEDPIDRVSCRPDFAILCYPVIAFDEPFTHRGSQRNLLGENPDPELIKKLSNEKSVTKENPPTFLFHTTDDQAVPVENAIVFYMALRRAGVPAEMHVFEPGRHGVGLAKGIPAVSEWSNHCLDWMRHHGWLPQKQG